VFPLDPRVAERQHLNPPPPGGRPFYTFYPGTTHLYDAVAPGTRNRTHTLTAYVDIPTGGAEGVIVADGGTASGYALYVKDGRPTYTYNYFRREVTTIAALDRLAAGTSVITLHFAYDGGGAGKGGLVTLSVNGKEVGRGRIERTQPGIFSVDDAADVGMDEGTPVVEDYRPRDTKFTGTIKKVVLEVGAMGQADKAAADKAGAEATRKVEERK
jgi:arylsulfatase